MWHDAPRREVHDAERRATLVGPRIFSNFRSEEGNGKRAKPTLRAPPNHISATSKLTLQAPPYPAHPHGAGFLNSPCTAIGNSKGAKRHTHGGALRQVATQCSLHTPCAAPSAHGLYRLHCGIFQPAARLSDRHVLAAKRLSRRPRRGCFRARRACKSWEMSSNSRASQQWATGSPSHDCAFRNRADRSRTSFSPSERLASPTEATGPRQEHVELL